MAHVSRDEVGRGNHVFLFDGHVRGWGGRVAWLGGCVVGGVVGGGAMAVESGGLALVHVTWLVSHVTWLTLVVSHVTLRHVRLLGHVRHVTWRALLLHVTWHRVITRRSHGVRVVVHGSSLHGHAWMRARAGVVARVTRVRVVPLVVLGGSIWVVVRVVDVVRARVGLDMARVRVRARVRARVGVNMAISRMGMTRVTRMTVCRVRASLNGHSRVRARVRARNSHIRPPRVRTHTQTLQTLTLWIIIQINQRTGIRIQPRRNLDLLQFLIFTRLQQSIFCGRSIKVRNQMKTEICGGGDTEGLFHESVGFVSISFGGGDELDGVGRGVT